MAEMNRSQCLPPPALCLRFPSLQSCIEDLPIVLQGPDNFPLVMGILQEINHESVGSSNRMDNSCLVLQRPCDQQMHTLALSKVKLENLDVEDHHQHSFTTNPDLYQEWSLKGVEELLTDPEELQLRHDCCQQALEAASHSELTSAQDEKPLFVPQFLHSQRASDEPQLLIDEKPALCSQVQNSLKEQVPLQGRVLPVVEFCEVKSGLHALKGAVLTSDKTHQQLSEDRLGLDNLQAVKREPEEHACCSEAQMQERCFLPDGCTSISSELVHTKENTACLISKDEPQLTRNIDIESSKNRIKSQVRNVQSSGFPEGGGASLELKDKMTMRMDCEPSKRRRITLQVNEVQSSGLRESDVQLTLETEIKKKWTGSNSIRSTSAILALPGELAEQERSEVLQKPLSALKLSAAEGPMRCTVSFERRGDSPRASYDFEGGDGKHQAVSSDAQVDFCELTLSLGSSQPQTTNSHPKNLVCTDFPEEKPVVRNLFVHEVHHGQCQRTNTKQWQQAKRCGSHGVFCMPVFKKKPLCPSLEECKLECHTDGEGSTKVAQGASKSFEIRVSSADEIPAKKPLLCKQGQLSSPGGYHITERKSCLDGGVSGRNLHVMLQRSEGGGVALDEGGAEGLDSEDGEPIQKIAQVSSNNVQLLPVSSQGELASKPHKKRMRGTLLVEEKRDGVEKEKDTRCHRSDGKSWRCTRECINGAYYCQYHLRARRIGYNRRKNRDAITEHHESVIKKSPKSSGMKSRSRKISSSCDNKP